MINSNGIKSKIHFRILSKKVTIKECKYIRRLFLECLKENQDIADLLNKKYKNIQVCFYYEATDLNIENTLRSILNDNTYRYSTKPNPAFTVSRKNIGCIVVFMKHLKEYTQKRDDVKDIEKYQKNGIFEELCHLVEQKGDGSVNPSHYWALWRLYVKRNLLLYGNEIIAQLDTDRNHYEVYLMMVKDSPNDWIERYWKYFLETSDTYKKRYEQWKFNTPINIVYARLITDFLREINVLCVVDKVPREKLSDENKGKLDILIEKGNLNVEKKKSLIEKDMGSGALTLINSLDESIFKTSESFFGAVLDLWISLGL